MIYLVQNILVYGNLLLATLILSNITNKHIYPESIAPEVRTALSHYPELTEVSIEFKFKSKIRKSIMQAQPGFWSLFRKKSKRKYRVLISESFKIEDTLYLVKNLPSDVLVGWLGHELGHIRDYQERSGLNLVLFGVGYLFSEEAMKRAERTADSYAIAHGMESYILATKNFILNEAGFPEPYKNRIKRFYLSLEEIMILIEERDSLTEPSSQDG